MRRRQFITMLAWPLAVRAQAKRPLLGYLGAAASASVVPSLTNLAFVKALRDHGYVEGRDIDIAYRFAEGSSTGCQRWRRSW